MTCTVAYQGGPGAFAEEACRLFLPDCLAVARASFADVAEAVRAGEAGFGMLPRENNSVGSVPGVAELIERNGLTVRGIHALPVRLHLMARPGVTLEEVRIVVSHPMALAQSAMTLQGLGLDTEEAANTALAAQSVGAVDNRTRAAIASETAAAAYGLTILRRDVHDRPDNATIFCVVARH